MSSLRVVHDVRYRVNAPKFTYSFAFPTWHSRHRNKAGRVALVEASLLAVRNQAGKGFQGVVRILQGRACKPSANARQSSRHCSQVKRWGMKGQPRAMGTQNRSSIAPQVLAKVEGRVKVRCLPPTLLAHASAAACACARVASLPSLTNSGFLGEADGREDGWQPNHSAQPEVGGLRGRRPIVCQRRSAWKGWKHHSCDRCYTSERPARTSRYLFRPFLWTARERRHSQYCREQFGATIVTMECGAPSKLNGCADA